jgi:pyruvate formate lyase activating enzyme
VSFEEVLIFLRKRLNLLDGVVFGGGECTIHKDLFCYVSEVKKLGMKVKIDTNVIRQNQCIIRYILHFFLS